MERVEYKVAACWMDESEDAPMMVISEFGITERDDRYYGLDLVSATDLAKNLESEEYFGVEIREFSVTMF